MTNQTAAGQPEDSAPETSAPAVDNERIHERALELTPEELAAGSDDPERQAQVILEDSDERTGA